MFENQVAPGESPPPYAEQVLPQVPPQPPDPQPPRQLVPQAPPEPVNLFPSCFDYAAKRHSVTNCIDKSPVKFTCDKFKPRCVAYSNRDDTIYVLSGNDVLKFNTSRRGKQVATIHNIKDLALSESGHVICVTDHYAMRLEQTRVNKLKSFVNAVQICSHLNQVVVLVIGHKYLVQFYVDGTFIRGIGRDQLKNVDKNSRMCMGSDGRIYVYSGVEVEKQNIGERLCYVCDKYEEVLIQWKIVVHVFNINGEYIRKYTVEEDERFDYKLTCKLQCRRSCCEYHRYPIMSSVPTKEEIAKKHAVGGLFVDADGYITLTQPVLGQIRVFNLHCPGCHVIVNPEIERNAAEAIKKPSGVCLTPQNKMIVCDMGLRRVQIL